jgi:hypothetical protein
MSSTIDRGWEIESRLMVGGVLLAGLWYGSHQLLYSLYFFYQLASAFWPGVFPTVR